jgi:radical SAM superfamily enzyme YgiQ (UPF0313 family)
VKVLLINSNSKADLLAAAPIGLCYVATATRQAGHDVRVLDLCFKKDVPTELTNAITGFGPDVIGVSVRNIDNANMLHPQSYLSDASRVVQQARRLSSAVIVVGGSGASLCPGEALRDLAADFIVVADGEKSFPGLLDALQNGSSFNDIPGVGFFRDGRFNSTPPAFDGFSVSNPGLGSWIDMAPYQKVGSSYTVQTRRGCRFNCIYCSYNRSLEGKSIRLRQPREVVDEIEEAVMKFKPGGFEFVDSVFNDPIDHCVEILEEIIRRPWKARFTAMGVSPRQVDSKFLEIMWRAGFTSFMMTPESASESMIKNYVKGFSGDDLTRAVDALKSTRFTVLWYFLIGGPGETNATLKESLDFATRRLAQKRRPPYHMANFYLGVRLYPNTRLWEIAQEERFVSPSSNPLDQLWYVSEELDLDRAVAQLTEAAAKFPEICLGFDEKYLLISKAVGFLGDLLKLPKPYWRHYWGANNLLIKCGLRSVFQPGNIADELRSALAHQGYRGRLLDGPSNAK